MGELTVSVSIEIEGKSQELPDILARLCGNLNCERGEGGARKYFPVLPMIKKKYCCYLCQQQWSNKLRQSSLRRKGVKTKPVAGRQ